MMNEIVVELYGDERIVLTFGDLKKIVDEKINLTAEAKKSYSINKIIDADKANKIADINDLFFYITKDAMDGGLVSEKVVDMFRKLSGYLEERVMKVRDNAVLWEIAEAMGFLFALSEMIVVARGYDEDMLEVREGGVREISVPVDREKWAKSVKKTLKDLGILRYGG